MSRAGCTFALAAIVGALLTTGCGLGMWAFQIGAGYIRTPEATAAFRFAFAFGAGGLAVLVCGLIALEIVAPKREA